MTGGPESADSTIFTNDNVQEGPRVRLVIARDAIFILISLGLIPRIQV